MNFFSRHSKDDPIKEFFLAKNIRETKKNLFKKYYKLLFCISQSILPF
jgi:hypothetical protein